MLHRGLIAVGAALGCYHVGGSEKIVGKHQVRLALHSLAAVSVAFSAAQFQGETFSSQRLIASAHSREVSPLSRYNVVKDLHHLSDSPISFSLVPPTEVYP